jgi:hypothetical protein
MHGLHFVFVANDGHEAMRSWVTEQANADLNVAVWRIRIAAGLCFSCYRVPPA